MEFGFALDLIFVPLLGTITVCGLYCAVRALVRPRRTRVGVDVMTR